MDNINSKSDDNTGDTQADSTGNKRAIVSATDQLKRRRGGKWRLRLTGKRIFRPAFCLVDMISSIVSILLWEAYGYYLLNRELYMQQKANISSIQTVRQDLKSTISSYSKYKGTETNLSEYELKHGCRLGIHNHADTLCAGKHVRILEYIDWWTFKVDSFHGSYKPLEKWKWSMALLLLIPGTARAISSSWTIFSTLLMIWSIHFYVQCNQELTE